MNSSKPSPPRPAGAHDHSHDHSHAHDTGYGMMLTPARQRIFDVLVQAQKPLGAYDIINHMAKVTGKGPAPISVYRALDYLVDMGCVHRLASRNAYLACGHGHTGEEPVAFLICDACGGVSEVMSDALGQSLGALARGQSFTQRQSVIELAGLCAPCAAAKG